DIEFLIKNGYKQIDTQTLFESHNYNHDYDGKIINLNDLQSSVLLLQKKPDQRRDIIHELCTQVIHNHPEIHPLGNSDRVQEIYKKRVTEAVESVSQYLSTPNSSLIKAMQKAAELRAKIAHDLYHYPCQAFGTRRSDRSTTQTDAVQKTNELT